jgi:hypothetical protein
MRIPKSFQLLGHTVTVTQEEDLYTETGGVGEANYHRDTIKVLKSSKASKISEDLRGHAYYHELSHHILRIIGKDKLWSDEEFVDLLGGLLHQHHKTKKY